ncbi:IMEF encapsulin system ferritin-like cargo protein [Gracilibacillus sp. YIM 98692]|uniref:IMEF encapsulin system ferritin-like cargo protein n=1 Tax=Gracilibacillus sp. YIM 98692 TaxID=2663532 RepID=UPI0013D6B5B8|nr:IMEF encapsulin system ferritin-like cargo protein [Gracilibacillus sp. YIM 98692]
MSNSFIELNEIFLRTRENIHDFMAILTPRIENAQDDHERLYYHHIYEEEEQRLDRLNALIPKLDYFNDNDNARTADNFEFIHILQDISLEKFGLHNFLEHLDLALFTFKDTEHAENLTRMRNSTDTDYQAIKVILSDLNDTFDGAASAPGSVPTDEKEDVNQHLKIDKYTTNDDQQQKYVVNDSDKPAKQLTVGSLKK